jgi:hypothetical protein
VSWSAANFITDRQAAFENSPKGVDAETSAKLLEIATEYREMLNGKAPVDAEDRLIAC